MKLLNVCLVSPLPPPYGGIAHWGGLVTRYAEKVPNIKVTVVNIAPRWRSIHDLGIIKRIIGGGLQLLRDLFRLFLVLLFNQIDVVHLTTPGQLGVLRDVGVFILTWCFKVPLVYHIRFGRVPDISSRNVAEWRLLKFVALRAFAVIAIDEVTGDVLKRNVPKASVVVIPNCVDFSSLPAANAKSVDYKVVLFVGWVVPTKGISELLESWSKIRPLGWKLKIIGSSKQDYIDSLLQKYAGVEVEFLGELSHKATMIAMSECEIFVLPSYTEGFPNVVLEAMALGKAIVASNVGAIPEMLSEDCGLLIKPREVDELASSLSSLIADEPARKLMGQNARNRALQLFSLESVFTTYMSLWRRAGQLE